MQEINGESMDIYHGDNKPDRVGSEERLLGSRYLEERDARGQVDGVLFPGVEDCPGNNRRLVVFLSYAVTPDSAGREDELSGGPLILPGLFHYVEKNVQRIEAEKKLRTEVWKIVGDEIIFTVDVRSAKDIPDILYYANDILLTVNKLLEKRSMSVDPGLDIAPEAVRSVKFKATAWAAIVNNVIKHRTYRIEPSENIYMQYRNQSDNPFGEYFGGDMDIGRRLQEYSRAGRLAVSFELAYILFSMNEGRFLQIVSYENIRGVWNNHAYPVIWYHRPKNSKMIADMQADFENSFAYDAGINDELVRKYMMVRQGIQYNNFAYPVAPVRFAVSDQTMNKIAADAGVLGKLDKMKELLSHSEAGHNTSVTDFMKVDCAAVCYYVDHRGTIQLLAMKTSGTNPGDISKWCFGSADAFIEKNLTESLVEQYREDLNLEIAPLVYSAHSNIRESVSGYDETEDPIPIALFERKCVRSEGDVRKGIICVAKIIGNNKVPRCDGIYGAYRYISEFDLTQKQKLFGKDMTVENFERSMRLALRLIHEYEGCKVIPG